MFLIILICKHTYNEQIIQIVREQKKKLEHNEKLIYIE